jgi:3-hydroxyacyl-[acyl-carrier-protein] dehydratase
MSDYSELIKRMPYGKNFLFIDEISYVDSNKIKGSYTFKKDLFFYDSHFINKPLVPGVIVTECLGQIGMVAHLLFFNRDSAIELVPVLSNMEVTFFKEVKFELLYNVIGEKQYYRNNTLKSRVIMENVDGEIVAGLTANIMIQKISTE